MVLDIELGKYVIMVQQIVSNMKLTLTKKLLGLLYFCVTREMERCDRQTPPDRVDDLQKLQILLSKYLQ